MTTRKTPPAASSASSASSACAAFSHVSDLRTRARRSWLAVASIARLAGAILVEYVRSGWILAELAYVLALYLFAFGYPFEPPFFFETANWGLGLLTAGATALLVSRAMRPALVQSALAHTTRRAYIAGLLLAAAALRIVIYLALLALVLLGHRVVNATGGALLTGSLGLIAGCVVLAALVLALSPAFAPHPARLVFLAWLAAALYSYIAVGWQAALFFIFRLPLLPLFAGYAMGMTGTIGWGGLLALIVDAAYVAGLVLLADFWWQRRDTAPAASADSHHPPAQEQPATARAPTRSPVSRRKQSPSVPRGRTHR